MKVDALIVGGGLIGVTTLYELVSRGVDAALVEALPDVACETSYANGSMLTPSMSDPWNSPGVGRHLLASFFDPASAMKLRIAQVPRLATWGLEFLRNSTPKRHMAVTLTNFRLAAYSLAHTRRLVEQIGVKMDGNGRGTIKLFESEAAMAGPLAIARMLEPHGLNYRVLDAAAVIALEPGLRGTSLKIYRAIHYPEDGVGDARLFTQQVAVAAREAGGRLLLNTRVRSLAPRQGGGFDLKTDTGTLSARRVVLAAGTATRRLAQPLGVRLPIRPAKGYSLTFDMSGVADRPSIALVDDAMHAAIVPLGSRIRIAGTAEFAGENRHLDPNRIDNLARLLRRVYPAVAEQVDADRAEAWAGLRPMSADGRPFIGETRIPGLWINAGHGHLGWTMAAGSSRLAAQLILDGRSEHNMAPFAIQNRTI